MALGTMYCPRHLTSVRWRGSVPGPFLWNWSRTFAALAFTNLPRNCITPAKNNLRMIHPCLELNQSAKKRRASIHSLARRWNATSFISPRNTKANMFTVAKTVTLAKITAATSYPAVEFKGRNRKLFSDKYTFRFHSFHLPEPVLGTWTLKRI